MPVCVWACVCAILRVCSFLRMCIVLACRNMCICIAVQRTCAHTPVSRQVCVLDFRGSLVVARLCSADYSSAEKALARQWMCQNVRVGAHVGKTMEIVSEMLFRSVFSHEESARKKPRQRQHGRTRKPSTKSASYTCTVPCPHQHPSHRSHPYKHTRPFQNQP